MSKQWKFSAKLWVYQGPAAWHFITLPGDIAEEIRFYQERKPGFGTVKVFASLGKSHWQTALFPDKASGSYFLPIKAAIRKEQQVKSGDKIEVSLKLKDQL